MKFGTDFHVTPRMIDPSSVQNLSSALVHDEIPAKLINHSWASAVL